MKEDGEVLMVEQAESEQVVPLRRSGLHSDSALPEPDPLYRLDSLGRRLKVDASGSVVRANSVKPACVHSSIWKHAPPEARQVWVDKQAELDRDAKSKGKGGSSSSTDAVPALDPVFTHAASYAPRGFAMPCTHAEPECEPVPAMPTVQHPPRSKRAHREKIPRYPLPFSACVARPVGRAELLCTDKAREAMDEEYKKLRYKKHPSLTKPGCWDESKVRARADVMADARKKGKIVHFGTIFGICVEKGSELHKDDGNRKFKGRYVFRGNDVKDQNWEAAMFQELGSSPAAMEASKSADFYGCLPGYACHQSDAEQAYTQALMQGTETWVSLPKDKWPDHFAGIHNPVVPLWLALYGHPHAGNYWEDHCDKNVKAAGFVRITDWRSCYWHPILKLFLVIYVDDFKLSGPVDSYL